MTLQYNWQPVADLTVSGLTGARGVGVRYLQLSIRFAVFNRSERGVDVRIDSLSALVSVKPAGGNLQYLGLGQFESPLSLKVEDHAYQSFFLMRVELTDTQVLALETMRGGGGLEFQIDVRGLGHAQTGTVPVADTVNYSANLSKWADVLRELGYADVFVVGIELPLRDIPLSLSSAAGMLRTAQRQLLAGEYSVVVATCRNALDSILAALDVSESVQAARTNRPKDSDDETKLQRALKILAAVRRYAHLAHHVSNDGHPEWYSRSDATLVLSTTSALLTSGAEWLALTPDRK